MANGRQVVILHGWSDTSRSFHRLADFLKAHGYKAVPLWLGDYISMQDDVTPRDVARRMEAVVRERQAKKELAPEFDLIVHSTGGLVAREWIASHYGDGAGRCPARRLVMLAPANFGSKLAATGKSMVGRVVKGWDHWFHTGTGMLDALELSSPYQWDLAERDLFARAGGVAPLYGAGAVLPFVISGSHPYPSKLRQIVNENGTDGTVRVPAANLNAHGVTIDFAADEENPPLTPWPTRQAVDFPLAVVPDRTHASIIDPDGGDIALKPGTAPPARLGEAILAALACPDDAGAYQEIGARWRDISEATAALAGDNARRAALFKRETPPEYFHQYLQVNVRVTDDHGEDVGDYFLEFSGPEEEKGDRSAVYFHREVLEHVHVNGTDPSLRCLFVDRTDLLANYYGQIRGKADKVLTMSVSAAPPGRNVTYFSNEKVGAKGSVTVHLEEETKAERRWLRRNTTHFVHIVIPRHPKEGVFRLTRA